MWKIFVPFNTKKEKKNPTSFPFLVIGTGAAQVLNVFILFDPPPLLMSCFLNYI